MKKFLNPIRKNILIFITLILLCLSWFNFNSFVYGITLTILFLSIILFLFAKTPNIRTRILIGKKQNFFEKIKDLII